MDVNELTGLARQLSRDEFATRFPQLFFLFYEEKSGISPVQFRTEVVSPRSAIALDPEGVFRVLPVTKAPGNPYPDRISVGRARNCDVVLRHPSVSKLHAHVRREEDGRFALVDTGSHNGTQVNGRPVKSQVPVPLSTGDLVTLGAVTVRVADAPELHLVLTRLFAIPR